MSSSPRVTTIRTPRPHLGVLARLGSLGLGLLLLVTTTGCEPVGKGSDPDPVIDLSRPADLQAPPMCTPKNCNGCCQDDVCQPGIAATACGTAGNACIKCSDAQMCGASFMCSFDPNGRWLVATVQATLSPTNSTGMQWRSDGSMPQPLVQFNTADRTNATAVVVSGTAPNLVWTVTWAMGFVYPASELLSTGLDLQVLDKLNTTMTQPMSNKHHVTFSQQDFATKNLTYQNWEGVKTLSVVLQKQ